MSSGHRLSWQQLTWLLTTALLGGLLLTDLSGWLLHRTDHKDSLLALVDARSSDWLLRQNAQAHTPSPDVVMVNIDQKSLDQIDTAMNDKIGSWPWPRSVHAELIADIEQQNPRAIVFDVMFNEPDEFRPDSDRALRDTAAQFSNLFFASTLLGDGSGWPLRKAPPSLGFERGPGANAEALAPVLVPDPHILNMENWQGGLINFETDADGIGRHARLRTTLEGWLLPSMAASVVKEQGWALPQADRIRLNWYGAPFRSYSYSDLIRDFSGPHPAVAPHAFTDKIVIVGATAPGLGDFRPTGLRPSHVGMEVIGTAISNLQNDDWLRDIPSRDIVLLLLLPALGFCFSRRLPPMQVGLGLLAASLAILGGSYALLRYSHGFAPVMVALAAAWLLFAILTLMAQLLERREREATVAIFGRFLDPRVVGDLVKSGEISREQKAQSREISILFSDIRGFTTLSETRTPEAVVELLNRYFNAQVEVIFRHGGTLDKFIGDAIMAFWNAPTHDPDHAVNATRAAVEMAQVLDDFKRELMTFETGLEDFDIGIGIHTGPAVVGFLGADIRLDYTAIGDTVNLASRIEGCTKGVSRVLVSGATRVACGHRISFKDHGEFHVKGRAQGVELFEPLSDA